MTPANYNHRAIARGELSDEHLVELVRAYQRAHGLDADGIAGPKTRAALDRAIAGPMTGELRVSDGWLFGYGVQHLPAHASWYGSGMPLGPRAIVAHYTATAPGAAVSMASRRMVARGRTDRQASWHITIATTGDVIQMVPLDRRAWHCASGLVRLGAGSALRPNACAIGIELEGLGDVFPATQVAAAQRVWRALVRAYGIPRELAMLEHSALDPARRSDPGPVWMREHAPGVLDRAFE